MMGTDVSFWVEKRSKAGWDGDGQKVFCPEHKEMKMDHKHAVRNQGGEES